MLARATSSGARTASFTCSSWHTLPHPSSRQGLAPSSHPRRHHAGRISRCRAADDNKQGRATAASKVDLDEARIEALEASTRRARSTRRQIPIRGVKQPKVEQQQTSGRAVWKKEQLLPEGWEQMDTAEKLTELYLGERGVLYWATQSAWYSIWILVAAWALLRFVGPNLGLYDLNSDLLPPKA